MQIDHHIKIIDLFLDGKVDTTKLPYNVRWLGTKLTKVIRGFENAPDNITVHSPLTCGGNHFCLSINWQSDGEDNYYHDSCKTVQELQNYLPPVLWKVLCALDSLDIHDNETFAPFQPFAVSSPTD